MLSHLRWRVRYTVLKAKARTAVILLLAATRKKQFSCGAKAAKTTHSSPHAMQPEGIFPALYPLPEGESSPANQFTLFNR
jgi:hypothetical protein